jgi:uncharacterized protein YndB with AHSA1/START domain
MGLEISPLHVRRSGFILATAERVFEEFTTFERLAAWFGTGHQLEVYEPEVGGRVLLSVEIDGAKRRFGGKVLVYEWARELSFTNDWESDSGPVPTLFTLRLSPLYDGCHMEIFHHGFDRLGIEAGSQLQGYEQGWDSHHIDHLKKIVEG